MHLINNKKFSVWEQQRWVVNEISDDILGCVAKYLYDTWGHVLVIWMNTWESLTVSKNNPETPVGGSNTWVMTQYLRDTK